MKKIKLIICGEEFELDIYNKIGQGGDFFNLAGYEVKVGVSTIFIPSKIWARIFFEGKLLHEIGVPRNEKSKKDHIKEVGEAISQVFIEEFLFLQRRQLSFNKSFPSGLNDYIEAKEVMGEIIE